MMTPRITRAETRPDHPRLRPQFPPSTSQALTHQPRLGQTWLLNVLTALREVGQ